MSRAGMALTALAGSIFCLGCGDGNMGWERRPIFTEEYMHTFAVAITDSGNGFLGASIGSQTSIREPNYKRATAMDTAIIQATRDDWNSKKEAFRGKGEINSLHHLDSGRLLAENSQVDLATLTESTHFIQWNGSVWKDVSSLDSRVVLILTGGGSCVFAASYPPGALTPPILKVSFDGGASWSSLTLGGMDPLGSRERDLLWMDPEGYLYAITTKSLEAFDLPHWKEHPTWKTLHSLPEGFKPIRMTGNSGGILSIGRLADSSLAIWRVPKSGSPELLRTRGLLPTLNPDRIWARGSLLRVTGTEERLKDGETTGYRNWLFESKDNGTTWKDLDLPLKGSLGSIAFGEDGRIWAMAAGNRMQVYHP
ncbi:MAG: hypothetical protein ABIW76_20290 [Fibrobacteria bacterium]